MTAKEILRQHLHGHSDELFEKELSHYPLCEVIEAMKRYVEYIKLTGMKTRNTFTLSPEAEAILANQPNKSRFVSEAIIEKGTDRMTHYHDILRASREFTKKLEDMHK